MLSLSGHGLVAESRAFTLAPLSPKLAWGERLRALMKMIRSLCFRKLQSRFWYPNLWLPSPPACPELRPSAELGTGRGALRGRRAGDEGAQSAGYNAHCNARSLVQYRSANAARGFLIRGRPEFVGNPVLPTNSGRPRISIKRKGPKIITSSSSYLFIFLPSNLFALIGSITT